MDSETSLETSWTMQLSSQSDGSTILIPYFLYNPATPPTLQTFDPQPWLSLEACALGGEFDRARIRLASDGIPCIVVITGLGPKRALLPIAVEREGEWLRVYLYQGSTPLRVDARRVP
jgi:hypothetical protein